MSAEPESNLPLAAGVPVSFFDALPDELRPMGLLMMNQMQDLVKQNERLLWALTRKQATEVSISRQLGVHQERTVWLKQDLRIKTEEVNRLQHRVDKLLQHLKVSQPEIVGV